MKKTFTILSLLTIGLSFSQVSITQENFAQIGVSLKYGIFVPSPQDTVLKGANVTWDFSEKAIGDTILNEFVEVENTPYASSFPTTQIAQLGYESTSSNTPAQYQYYEFDSKRLAVKGNYSLGIETKMPDPEEILTFPMTYLDEINDDFGGQMSSSGFPYTREGKSYNIADGYGTLKLPNGFTYENVLRVKRVSKTKDNFGFGEPLEGTIISFNWISADETGILFTINYFYNNGMLSSSTGLSVSEQSMVGTQDYLARTAIVIYPTTTNDYVFFETEESIESIIVYNITGEVLLYEDQVNDRLSVENLKKGVYVLDIMSNGEHYQKRIQKL